MTNPTHPGQFVRSPGNMYGVTISDRNEECRIWVQFIGVDQAERRNSHDLTITDLLS